MGPPSYMPSVVNRERRYAARDCNKRDIMQLTASYLRTLIFSTMKYYEEL
jgi:hypothetical protein